MATTKYVFFMADGDVVEQTALYEDDSNTTTENSLLYKADLIASYTEGKWAVVKHKRGIVDR